MRTVSLSRRLVAQHLERPLDAGERVLDLVRQAGGELAEARQLIDVRQADGDVGLALALPGEELAQAAVDLGGDRIERQRRARGKPGRAARGGGAELLAEPRGRAPHRPLDEDRHPGDERHPGRRGASRCASA